MARTSLWVKGKTPPSEWIFPRKSLPQPMRKYQDGHTAKNVT